jgi:hypothetical protein
VVGRPGDGSGDEGTATGDGQSQQSQQEQLNDVFQFPSIYLISDRPWSIFFASPVVKRAFLKRVCLAGDTYFKVHREGHNLDRCRTQFKLVESIQQQLTSMERLVEAGA